MRHIIISAIRGGGPDTGNKTLGASKIGFQFLAWTPLGPQIRVQGPRLVITRHRPPDAEFHGEPDSEGGVNVCPVVAISPQVLLGSSEEKSDGWYPVDWPHGDPEDDDRARLPSRLNEVWIEYMAYMAASGAYKVSKAASSATIQGVATTPRKSLTSSDRGLLVKRDEQQFDVVGLQGDVTIDAIEEVGGSH